jgi:hypothetical protein
VLAYEKGLLKKSSRNITKNHNIHLKNWVKPTNNGENACIKTKLLLIKL